MARVAPTSLPFVTRVWVWRVAHITSSTMLKAASAAVFTCSSPSTAAVIPILPSLGLFSQETPSPASAPARRAAASFSWISSSARSITYKWFFPSFWRWQISSLHTVWPLRKAAPLNSPGRISVMSCASRVPTASCKLIFFNISVCAFLAFAEFGFQQPSFS